MDGNKFSAIGHHGMDFWNPVGGLVIDDWVRELQLSPTAKVLDIGCGRAELLRRIHQTHSCSCVGVDPSALALEAAATSSSNQDFPITLDLRQQNFQAEDFQAAEFDLIACIGSTHAVGNTAQCLQVFGDLLQNTGHLWLGIGYWQRNPDQGYLDFLQCASDDMLSHDGNLNLFADQGWRVDRHHLTSTEEWGAYEDGYAGNLQKFLADHPHDPDFAAMKERIEAWRGAYLKWGKSTLGFGMYLLQRLSASAAT